MKRDRSRRRRATALPVERLLRPRARPGWALAAAVAVGVLGACEDAGQTAVVPDGIADIDADAIVYSMTEFLTREGIRRGKVTADSAYVYRDSSTARLYSVDMQLFEENGADRAAVVADSGRLHQRTDEMVAWGHVVLTVPDDDVTIETSELRYDPNSNRISSDVETVYTRAGRVTRGSCFRSDLDFRNFEVCAIRGAAGVGRQPGSGPGNEGPGR